MIKRFFKDNRGQVLYAVLVTVMFIGMLSMITMGLTLKNYNASLNKQQHVSDYYAADAVAELYRIGEYSADTSAETLKQDWNVVVKIDGNEYTITCGTVTITTTIESGKFTSWEVSYHAVETEAADEQSSQ